MGRRSRSDCQDMYQLRRLKSLQTVVVIERGWFPAAEFWRRYDAGEFK